MKLWLSVVGVVLFFINTCYAQDRIFAYTYQTNILNKGSVDLEYHTTIKTGKKGIGSPYLFGQKLKQQLELEFGLGRKVQTAFYFNAETNHLLDSTSTAIEKEYSINISNEWKWKITDPVANAIGIGLYSEIEVGASNIELENKILLDKQYRKNIFALNIISIYEAEKEITHENNITKALWEKSMGLDFCFGYLHKTNKKIQLGFETKNNNIIDTRFTLEKSILFIGTAVHFTINNCFINITALPQIGTIYKSENSVEKIDVKDFERFELKFIAGYSF